LLPISCALLLNHLAVTMHVMTFFIVAFQLLFILSFCCPKFHRRKLELHFMMVLNV